MEEKGSRKGDGDKRKREMYEKKKGNGRERKDGRIGMKKEERWEERRKEDRGERRGIQKKCEEK